MRLRALIPAIGLLVCSIAIPVFMAMNPNPPKPDELPTVVWGVETVDRADTLVVYSASWCAPCRSFKKRILLPLANEGYDIEIRDIDPNNPISASSVGKCRLIRVKKGDYKPRAVPTIYLFAGGIKLSNKGLRPSSSMDQFRRRLKKKNTEN